jgi:hypothetical protein
MLNVYVGAQKAQQIFIEEFHMVKIVIKSRKASENPLRKEKKKTSNSSFKVFPPHFVSHVSEENIHPIQPIQLLLNETKFSCQFSAVSAFDSV